MREIIDFTRVIHNNMPVYPGDKNVKLTQTSSYEKDGYNNYSLTMELHSGTHLDGLSHISKIKEQVSDIRLEKLIGLGSVIDAQGQDVIEYKPEYEEQVIGGTIILIKTGFDKYWGSDKYFLDYPQITSNMAQFLIDKKILALCIDTPAPDRSPYNIHKMFFESGIYIIENLINIESAINIKKIEVFIIPLKITADSSPARVFGVVI